jgi:Na+/proline symporter
MGAMNEFLKSTFTRQKFQGLFVNTALGNFAGYVAGSLVTIVSTYHSVERRAIRNLFGILPRKKIVVHLLPEWLEWLLALIVGFLVMELVRYLFNYRMRPALSRRPSDPAPPADRSANPSPPPGGVP